MIDWDEFSYLTVSEKWRLFRDKQEKLENAKVVLETLRAKLEKAEKVIDAANNMSQRLQSLPWHRQTYEKDAPTCLNHTVWKEWNYNECQKLFDALKEYRGET